MTLKVLQRIRPVYGQGCQHSVYAYVVKIIPCIEYLVIHDIWLQRILYLLFYSREIILWLKPSYVTKIWRIYYAIILHVICLTAEVTVMASLKKRKWQKWKGRWVRGCSPTIDLLMVNSLWRFRWKIQLKIQRQVCLLGFYYICLIGYRARHQSLHSASGLRCWERDQRFFPGVVKQP